jgi:small nuclear ribonucleoprotein (snRNP)-like protein
MTESDIQFLRDNVDKAVGIETRSGESLIAKI